MAYYTSTNRNELETYNTLVVEGEGYDRVHTTDWAYIISHPNGTDYAILKNNSYTSQLTEVQTLGSEWFPDEDII